MRKSSNEEKKVPIAGIMGICVVAVFVVLLVLFGKGKTTVSGKYPEDYKSRSLTCEIERKLYPVFTYDYSDRKTMEVKIIFGNEGAESFYLRQILYYHTMENIAGGEAHNIAALYKSFYADGMNDGALGSKFAKLDDSVQFTLFAPKKEMSQVKYKYFLLDRNAEQMTSVEEYKKAYENQGFVCTVSE